MHYEDRCFIFCQQRKFACTRLNERIDVGNETFHARNVNSRQNAIEYLKFYLCVFFKNWSPLKLLQMSQTKFQLNNLWRSACAINWGINYRLHIFFCVLLLSGSVLQREIKNLCIEKCTSYLNWSSFEWTLPPWFPSHLFMHVSFRLLSIILNCPKNYRQSNSEFAASTFWIFKDDTLGKCFELVFTNSITLIAQLWVVWIHFWRNRACEKKYDSTLFFSSFSFREGWCYYPSYIQLDLCI